MDLATVVALASVVITVAGWFVSIGKARGQLNGFGGRMKRFEEGLASETAERKSDVAHFEIDVSEIRQQMHSRDLEVEHRITLIEARESLSGE